MNPDQPQSQPQPSQPPPGYGTPQPPPGYMPPPPGYATPPGYAPPPGYGAQQPPPPGYMPPPAYMPPPVYVPPVAYHVPAGSGNPPQFVPPAQGSVAQAWVALATHPSRQNFVAWAQIATRDWIAQSIALGFAFYFVYTLLTSFGLYSLTHTIITGLPANGSANAAQVLAAFGNTYVITLILGLLSYLAQVFAFPFGQALFMPATFGPLGQRYQRALRPWALAQPAIAGIELLLGLILFGLGYLLIVPNLHNLSNAGNSQINTLASNGLVFVLVIGLFSVGSTAYLIMLEVQSGAVGAAMNRWAIFGINLLTSLVIGIAANIILQPIFLLIFHSAFSFTTTTSLLHFITTGLVR
jgi:hypothetical protein